MAIDPNISLGVRPIELANPLAQYGQIAQIQQAQQANQLNALKMQEAQATMEERNALRRLDPTAVDYESQLFRVNPQLGINYRKEAATTAAQKAAETKSLTETAGLKQKMLSQALRDISDRPSDANITAHTEDIQTSSLFSQEEKAKALITQQTLLAIPFEQRQSYLSQQGATASELRPVSVAAGASLVGRDNKVMFTAPERQDTDLIRNFNAAKAQGFAGNIFDYEKKIKEAGRTPPTPAQPSAPVAVVDPVTGKQVYVSREEALRGRMTPAAAMENLNPKEIQKREALLPQATQSLKTVNNTMSIIGQTVDKLLANPNGINGITGLIGGATPALTDAARAAKADLEQLKNLAFVQGLTELRAASKTGAGVGNVSNREGDRFENLKASLDRSQSKEDLIASLRKLKGQADFTAQTMQEAYDSTYSYKAGTPAAAAPAAPNIDALLNKYAPK